MKLSTITAATLLASSVSGATLRRRAAVISEESAIVNAVFGWRNDTGIVSNFVAEAGARTYTDNQQYHHGALIANYSETDELTYKGVLDTYLPSTQALQQANTTLVSDHTFLSVVQILQTLTSTAYSNKASIQAQVDHINNGNSTVDGRCQAVLPAIDTYFSQAADFVKQKYGNAQLDGLQAIRPAACSSSSSK